MSSWRRDDWRIIRWRSGWHPSPGKI